MIAVTRSLMRRFQAVHRRSRISKAPGALSSQVYLHSGADGLRLQAVSDQLALEYHQPGQFDAESLVVPVDLLANCEGRTDDLVTLAHSVGKIVATWTDRGIPQVVEYDTAPDASAADFPLAPESLEPNSPELCSALQAAVTIVPRERSRYALDCLQLRGRDGKIVVTDGRQILVQSGFRFPWHDDLLVPAPTVLTSKELFREGPVAVGISDDWIAFRFGPWTVWLRIEREARFPKTDDLIRQPTAAATRMTIDPLDAEFLARTLDRLPCNDEMNQSVTVDLGDQVSVRSQAATAARPTELVLSRSTHEGDNIAVATNREFLARAIKLGFREVCIFGPQAPVLCDDGRRQYVWALVDPESVVRASDDTVRIDSAAYGTPNPKLKPQVLRRRFTVSQTNDPPEAAPSNGKPPRPRTKSIAIDPNTSLIGQAIALRTAMRETVTQTNALIRSLKRDKRQSRLVASTLASLKQLQKVAG